MWWAGKWTQSRILADRIQEHFPDRVVHLVREPWWTPIAEAIRTLVQGTDFFIEDWVHEEMTPATNVYLYAASRAQLIHSVVKPALERGEIVISDRSVVSSIAIQWHGLWYGMDEVYAANVQALADISPDMIVFLDLPVHDWMARLSDAEWDKREREPTAFQEACDVWYRLIWTMPQFKSVRNPVDAVGSIEQVAERVWTTVSWLSVFSTRSSS